jgi:peptidoglycan/xylan/chitin deacetylase (PgdA/CDA1 family)
MKSRKLIPVVAVTILLLLVIIPTALVDPDTLTLVGSPTTIYAGMSVTFSEIITGPTPSDWSQTVYYGDGSNTISTGTERSFVHKYANAGTYTAYVEWTFSSTKIRSNDVVITVNGKPTANFTAHAEPGYANGWTGKQPGQTKKYTISTDNEVASPSKLNETLDYGWANAYANGTVYHDSSVKHDGAASLRIITNADGSACEAAKAIGIHRLGADNFRVFVRSDDWADVRGSQILLAEDSTMTKYFYLNFLDYALDLNTNNEWYELTFTRSEFESSGSPDWNNISFAILRGWSVSGKTPSIYFDTLQSFSQGRKGHVSVVFDDGWDTQYNQAFAYMQTKKLRGNIFVIPTIIGDAGRVTQSNLDDMAAAGWDISGHGESDLATLTESQMRSDVANTKAYLDQKGYKGRNIYAYPEGQNNNLVRSVVGENFEYGRTINALNQPLGYIPPYRINAFSSGNETSLTTIENYVDDAIANDEWAVLVFHKIVANPTIETEYSISNFQAAIDYIAASGVDCSPMSEVLENKTNQEQSIQNNMTDTPSGMSVFSTPATRVAATHLISPLWRRL